MGSWRDDILKHFERGVARLTLVADPDRLITEEGILNELHERGYQVVVYGDPIAFRYLYESSCRGAWEEGKGGDLVVLVREGSGADALPFDVQRHGRVLLFGLDRLFPGLDPNVLESLDRSLLDRLHAAYRRNETAVLTESATREFVLVHCYRIVPDHVDTPAALMRWLLDRHYHGHVLPDALDRLVLERISPFPSLKGFPLGEVIPDRVAFLRFLQEQWQAFATGTRDSEHGLLVPFEHTDIRFAIDDFFTEGLLRPIPASECRAGLPEWTSCGVSVDTKQDSAARFRRVLERASQLVPGAEASHREWQRFAAVWAEAVATRWARAADLDAPDVGEWEQLHTELEQRFGEWLVRRMGSLASLPPYPAPVMVHHIPQWLASLRSQGRAEKVALVVIDCLALDQWDVLQEELQAQEPGWSYDLTPVFTWVPTLTQVGRQALLAGAPPLYFPSSLKTTAQEGNLWRRWWEGTGVSSAKVGYVLSTSLGSLSDVIEQTADPRLEVVAVVLTAIDRSVHEGTLRPSDVQYQVRQWAVAGHLRELVSHLLGEGFAVFLASDHGNVPAVGVGTPKEGVLVESAGRRARVYSDPALRAETARQYPTAVEWTDAGLPPGCHTLLAGGLTAFAAKGEQVITHGGMATEEVIVPFVRVSNATEHQ